MSCRVSISVPSKSKMISFISWEQMAEFADPVVLMQSPVQATRTQSRRFVVETIVRELDDRSSLVAGNCPATAQAGPTTYSLSQLSFPLLPAPDPRFHSIASHRRSGKPAIHGLLCAPCELSHSNLSLPNHEALRHRNAAAPSWLG